MIGQAPTGSIGRHMSQGKLRLRRASNTCILRSATMNRPGTNGSYISLANDTSFRGPSPLGKSDPFLLAKTDPRVKQDLEQGGSSVPEGISPKGARSAPEAHVVARIRRGE